MTNQQFCQSCAMPITEEKFQGSESDGSLSNDFCTYCYQKGEFTQNVTMEEMVETCVPHMVDAGMPEAEARKLLNDNLPKLSRWAK